MMAVMTAQRPGRWCPPPTRLVGRAAAIAEDDDGGGRVFVHGNLA
jgi:hypothetical protein